MIRMSSHHGHDHIPTPPTSFWHKYVFSTDHKVIGIQFTFASLFFVIIGGLLALALRYQLAWPNQHIPFKDLLPGKMTAEAPEANVALWQKGAEVRISTALDHNGVKLPEGAKGRLVDFPQGLAVTIPAQTRVQEADGTTRELVEAVNAFVPVAKTMGDYDYNAQKARVPEGTVVQVPATEARAAHELTLLGVQVRRPQGGVTEIVGGQLLLPVRPDATVVAVKFPQQNIVNKEGEVTAQVQAVEFAPDAGLTADKVAVFKDALTTDAYIQLFTMHATVMVFFVLMPMLMGGFGNFLIPLMIGCRDMAFPKLNMLSFWIAVPSSLIMMVSFWTLGGAAGGGWTMYPTLSLQTYSPQLGTTLWLVAVGFVGFSTIVGTLNYITTIVNMRAPGMSMFRMPLTIWSLLITSVLALFATPVLTAAAFALLADRVLGTMFFDPTRGGQPLLWQHLFWFFGHPEVYILILPAMGIVSDVLSTNARKPIFGYKPMVFAICAIAGLGFIVWGHHMFQSGMNPIAGTTFMASTIMIAVPSAIKTFNWLGTLWGGNIRFTVPMLNALGFVSMFVIGGLSGIFMASAPVDMHIHDTYFIVAHIHYVLFGGTLFGVFTGIYYWFPKMFGRQLNQRWGAVHFWLTIIAFNGTFFTMHILGVGGHPRRYASIFEYPSFVHLQPLNVFMTICAMMLGMAQIPFFYNIFASLPYKLSRAMVALFTILFVLPMVMGHAFYNRWTADAGNFGSAMTAATLIGVVFCVATVVVVFALYAVGRKLCVGCVLSKLLYVVVLPLWLAPALIKKDMYMWLGVPELHAAWPVLLLLATLPGIAYFAIKRPKDEFGYAPGENPWQANTLEWTIPSPPKFHNFDVIPTVYRGAYEYSSPAVKEDYLPQPKQLPKGVVEPAGH
jgi:cytochrome c oxidase subunit 1